MSRASGHHRGRTRSRADLLDRTVATLRSRIEPGVELAIQLGSGFASVADGLKDVEAVPYAALPGFPQGVVRGHEGRLLVGCLGDTRVMSTVPEAIVARECALRVCALSCITNLASGLGGGSLSHPEVPDVAERVGEAGARLIETFARLGGQRTNSPHDATG